MEFSELSTSLDTFIIRLANLRGKDVSEVVYHLIRAAFLLERQEFAKDSPQWPIYLTFLINIVQFPLLVICLIVFPFSDSFPSLECFLRVTFHELIARSSFLFSHIHLKNTIFP